MSFFYYCRRHFPHIDNPTTHSLGCEIRRDAPLIGKTNKGEENHRDEEDGEEKTQGNSADGGEKERRNRRRNVSATGLDDGFFRRINCRRRAAFSSLK